MNIEEREYIVAEDKKRITNFRRLNRPGVLSDGSIYIPSRVVPFSEVISPEAYKWLTAKKRVMADINKNAKDLDEIRQKIENMNEALSKRAGEIYPVNISRREISGVTCDVFSPQGAVSENRRSQVLINLVGGMGMYGRSNFMEGIPISNLLQMDVIKPHFRFMPENPFPAGVDDVVNVYRELLNDYEPGRIGLFGGSSGGLMCFQCAAKMKHLGIPLPGAIASWGGAGGYTGSNDSSAVNIRLDYIAAMTIRDDYDKGCEPNQIDAMDELFSPIYSNLEDFPPTFLSAGTRDLALSGVALMHQALRESGVVAELNVFEGMPHGFIYYADLPEAQELYKKTADFFDKYLE